MIDIDAVQQAVVFARQGKFEEAEKIYNKLLSVSSDELILLSAAGLFYISLKNYDKAIELLEKAYKKQKTFGTVSALGMAEYKKQDYFRAATYLKEALEYGKNPDIYDKLIASLFEIRYYKEALEYCDKMFELYPDEERAVANKVKGLTQSGKLAEAEKFCVEYLKKNTNSPIMWFHLGYLKELIYCDDNQAKECYINAEKLGANEANFNIAVSCQKLGDKEGAEKYYKKMLELYPNDIETQNALGMLYLSQKKFKEGYELFYKRPLEKIKNFTNNIWKPDEKINDNVTIICDQGFGDHIQFIRYLSLIPAKTIKVAAPKQLTDLFKRNYPDIEFIEYKSINPNEQAIRITDLAYALNIDFDNIPFSEGYLKSDTKNIESDKLKVGLCWEAGSAGTRTMINRTIHIKCFEPFFDLDNVQIYSFQYDDTFKGNEKYPQLINLAKDFKDFSDTASALMAMDAVVTVDTSVAHLAGALGVKTYLLLPYTSDWRWFEDTKNTPWYKSIEIFKQNHPISWEKPLNDIINRLNA